MCGEKRTLQPQIFFPAEILPMSYFPIRLFIWLFCKLFYTTVFYTFSTRVETVFLCPPNQE